MSELPLAPGQIVFSGGGLRCFWQGGVMSVLNRHLEKKPKRVTGVSGGAMAAVAWLAGRERQLLDTMCDAFAAQNTNLDLFERDEEGLTPHQRIYCDVVETTIDSDVVQKIAEGPKLQILIAHPPKGGLPPDLSGTALTMAYEAELHTVNSPHFTWAEKLGLSANLVDANQAARDGNLVDLVSAAAVIPPVFEPPLWQGQRVVDGGMADQAPMPDPDEGETLILLTRKYARLPDYPERTYVHPDDETPADKIDFTDPKKLRDTWDQGVRNASSWLEQGLPDA